MPSVMEELMIDELKREIASSIRNNSYNGRLVAQSSFLLGKYILDVDIDLKFLTFSRC